MKRSKTFLSYSSSDRGLVTAVRGLLKGSHDEVFQDFESIQPGTKWSEAIDEALADAGSVYVFWCRHASRSEEVRKEYAAAVERNLTVIPVMLDKTPLSPELAQLHGVDFRETAIHPRFRHKGKIAAAPLLMLGGVAGFVAAGGGAAADMRPAPLLEPPIGVVSFEVVPQALEFTGLGEARTIAATVRTADGALPESNETIVWTTDSTDIASVDGVGSVTSVSSGTTTIRATLEAPDGVYIKNEIDVAVRAPWWPQARHDAWRATVDYGVPLGAIALVVGLVWWTRRRARRKRETLAEKILHDLHERGSAADGSTAPEGRPDPESDA